MNRFMKLAMISCKQAAILGTKQSLDGLSIIEGVKLRLHAKMCKTCQDYIHQNKLLDAAIEELVNQKKITSIKLSEEQRAKILEVLK